MWAPEGPQGDLEDLVGVNTPISEDLGAGPLYHLLANQSQEAVVSSSVGGAAASIARAAMSLSRNRVQWCTTLQFTKHNEEQRSSIVSEALQLLMTSVGVVFKFVGLSPGTAGRGQEHSVCRARCLDSERLTYCF